MVMPDEAEGGGGCRRNLHCSDCRSVEAEAVFEYGQRQDDCWTVRLFRPNRLQFIAINGLSAFAWPANCYA